MSLGTIVLIILIIALFGGGIPWSSNPNGPYPNAGHYYGTGYFGGGGLGLIVIVLIVLLLLGHI